MALKYYKTAGEEEEEDFACPTSHPFFLQFVVLKQYKIAGEEEEDFARPTSRGSLASMTPSATGASPLPTSYCLLTRLCLVCVRTDAETPRAAAQVGGAMPVTVIRRRCGAGGRFRIIRFK